MIRSVSIMPRQVAASAAAARVVGLRSILQPAAPVVSAFRAAEAITSVFDAVGRATAATGVFNAPIRTPPSAERARRISYSLRGFGLTEGEARAAGVAAGQLAYQQAQARAAEAMGRGVAMARETSGAVRDLIGPKQADQPKQIPGAGESKQIPGSGEGDRADTASPATPPPPTKIPTWALFGGVFAVLALGAALMMNKEPKAATPNRRRSFRRNAVSRYDRTDFCQFCAQATDRQLEEIIRREREGSKSDPDREGFYHDAMAEKRARERSR
jgi:hypothetical protein